MLGFEDVSVSFCFMYSLRFRQGLLRVGLSGRWRDGTGGVWPRCLLDDGGRTARAKWERGPGRGGRGCANQGVELISRSSRAIDRGGPESFRQTVSIRSCKSFVPAVYLVLNLHPRIHPSLFCSRPASLVLCCHPQPWSDPDPRRPNQLSGRSNMSSIRRRTSADPIPSQGPPGQVQVAAPAYPPPPLYVSTARVSPNVVNFTLRPRSKATLPPPSVELEGAVSASEWFSRLERLRTVLVKYEWSILERFGVVLGLLALVGVVSLTSSEPSGGGRGLG